MRSNFFTALVLLTATGAHTQGYEFKSGYTDRRTPKSMTRCYDAQVLKPINSCKV
jgi:hypothetical protein